MATFFDKFRRYAKDYSRERETKAADAFGHLSVTATQTADVRGILTKRRSSGSSMSAGKTEVGYWKNEDVFYCGPETDLEGGDFLVNWNERYLVRHVDWQDDFNNKNSHKIAYLERVT